MNYGESPEAKRLIARLEDLAAAAERGEVAVSQFLTPKELHIARDYLCGMGAPFAAYGGYPDAERRRVYLLPDYMEELSREESPIDLEEKISEFGYSLNITTLIIKGSGYRRLSHRDFLGSVLALGLERSVVGDILLLDEEGREAALFCDSAISEFLLRELTLVANDKVKTWVADVKNIKLPERRTAQIRDTVASPRFDAVIAALCGISRDKARACVEAGMAELDFEREERPDKAVSVPALISVRGYGRYKIISLSDKTKKGRFRLEAEKFI